MTAALTTLLAEVVNTDELVQTVAASFIAGIGVTAAFAFAILGTARFAEMRSGDRPLAAGVFAALAFLSMALVIGAIVFGIAVMMSK